MKLRVFITLSTLVAGVVCPPPMPGRGREPQGGPKPGEHGPDGKGGKKMPPVYVDCTRVQADVQTELRNIQANYANYFMQKKGEFCSGPDAFSSYDELRRATETNICVIRALLDPEVNIPGVPAYCGNYSPDELMGCPDVTRRMPPPKDKGPPPHGRGGHGPMDNKRGPPPPRREGDRHKPNGDDDRRPRDPREENRPEENGQDMPPPRNDDDRPPPPRDDDDRRPPPRDGYRPPPSREGEHGPPPPRPPPPQGKDCHCRIDPAKQFCKLFQDPKLATRMVDEIVNNFLKWSKCEDMDQTTIGTAFDTYWSNPENYLRNVIDTAQTVEEMKITKSCLAARATQSLGDNCGDVSEDDRATMLDTSPESGEAARELLEANKDNHKIYICLEYFGATRYASDALQIAGTFGRFKDVFMKENKKIIDSAKWADCETPTGDADAIAQSVRGGSWSNVYQLTMRTNDGSPDDFDEWEDHKLEQCSANYKIYTDYSEYNPENGNDAYTQVIASLVEILEAIPEDRSRRPGGPGEGPGDRPPPPRPREGPGDRPPPPRQREGPGDRPPPPRQREGPGDRPPPRDGQSQSENPPPSQPDPMQSFMDILHEHRDDPELTIYIIRTIVDSLEENQIKRYERFGEMLQRYIQERIKEYFKETPGCDQLSPSFNEIAVAIMQGNWANLDQLLSGLPQHMDEIEKMRVKICLTQAKWNVFDQRCTDTARRTELENFILSLDANLDERRKKAFIKTKMMENIRKDAPTDVTSQLCDLYFVTDISVDENQEKSKHFERKLSEALKMLREYDELAALTDPHSTCPTTAAIAVFDMFSKPKMDHRPPRPDDDDDNDDDDDDNDDDDGDDDDDDNDNGWCTDDPRPDRPESPEEVEEEHDRDGPEEAEEERDGDRPGSQMGMREAGPPKRDDEHKMCQGLKLFRTCEKKYTCEIIKEKAAQVCTGGEYDAMVTDLDNLWGRITAKFGTAYDLNREYVNLASRIKCYGKELTPCAVTEIAELIGEQMGMDECNAISFVLRLEMMKRPPPPPPPRRQGPEDRGPPEDGGRPPRPDGEQRDAPGAPRSPGEGRGPPSPFPGRPQPPRRQQGQGRPYYFNGGSK